MYKVIKSISSCSLCTSGHCGECSGGREIGTEVWTFSTFAKAKQKCDEINEYGDTCVLCNDQLIY